MGTDTTRIGNAGEDTPKTVESSVSLIKCQHLGVLEDST